MLVDLPIRVCTSRHGKRQLPMGDSDSEEISRGEGEKGPFKGKRASLLKKLLLPEGQPGKRFF